MKGTVLKYYSVTSGPLDYCLKRLQEVQKKRPERDYLLLKNMRGYYSTKCSLVWREEVEIDLPTEDELDLPAPVPKPPGVPPYGKDRVNHLAWADYDRDYARRKRAVADAQTPAFELLREPINP